MTKEEGRQITNYSFIFFKVKNSKNFLDSLNQINIKSVRLISELENSKYKNQLLKNLFSQIVRNNKEIEYYFNRLSRLLPNIDESNLKLISSEENEERTDFSLKDIKKDKNKDLDIDLLKKELEKIEKELLKLSIK